MGENGEKDEKELQKQEEKAFDEKWRRDPLGTLIWALTLIWAGTVWLAYNFDFFEDRRIRGVDLGFDPPVDETAWIVFFVGAAALVLLEVVIRVVMPAYRRPVIGSLIWAGVLLGLGLGQWTVVVPFILIGVGISILFRNLYPGQK